jgi:hypothetical protein
MKKSRLTEERIAYALRLAEGRRTVSRRVLSDRQLGRDLLHVGEELRRSGREQAAPAGNARGR